MDVKIYGREHWPVDICVVLVPASVLLSSWFS